jgi:S-adenosylmethionine decarboxylase
MKRIFGLHLLIDGFVNDGKTLYPDYIYDLFDKLVIELKMQYLQKPIVMRVPLDESKLFTDDDEGGYSGICQITTSHISIHGWPLRKAFMMDIFSCKEFDKEKAENIVLELLNINSYSSNLIKRYGPLPTSLPTYR